MDQSEDPRELERRIDLASRIASRINDQTTVERLRAWIEELRQRLRQRLEARRTQQAISAQSALVRVAAKRSHAFSKAARAASEVSAEPASRRQ
jgi:glutamate-1-semialdehyde aminotransferase